MGSKDSKDSKLNDTDGNKDIKFKNKLAEMIQSPLKGVTEKKI